MMSQQPVFRYVMLIVLALVCVCCAAQFSFNPFSRKPKPLTPAFQSKFALADIPFDGQRAFTYLTAICDIGPRCTGSEGMTRQQKLLTDHFRQFDCTIERQEFTYEHPLDKKPVPGCNLIVRWKPERERRILLCTHYDSLPFPLMDPKNPKGRFIGANDSGSGTALFMEFAHTIGPILQKEQTTFGVDFVFLDAEEFLFDPDGRFFVGSEFFAQQYKANSNRGWKYEQGVLLDMIGDADLQIYYDRVSLAWRESAPTARAIWQTARKLGVKEFIAMPKYAVNDDHVMLRNLGGIPCIDIIDFDYPAWHTCQDVPGACSPQSLAKVGWVLQEWLKNLQ